MTETKKQEVNVLDKVAAFAAENKGLFFVVGNPAKDELLIAFNEKVSLLRFPESIDKNNNVLVRMLNQMTFAQGMSDFISGLVKGLGLDPKGEETKIVMSKIGGATQAMVDHVEGIPSPYDEKK